MAHKQTCIHIRTYIAINIPFVGAGVGVLLGMDVGTMLGMDVWTMLGMGVGTAIGTTGMKVTTTIPLPPFPALTTPLSSSSMRG